MNKELTRETVLETVGVLALACLVIGHLAGSRWFVAAAALLLAVGLFVRPVAAAIARAWLRLAVAVGTVNSRILLTLIFFLFLTPIALLARLFRGDLLLLRRRSGADRSYWQPRGHAYTGADLEKLW